MYNYVYTIMCIQLCMYKNDTNKKEIQNQQKTPLNELVSNILLSFEATALRTIE